MKPSNCIANLISAQVFVSLMSYAECCNFGPGNLGFLNFGTGNVGIGNFGFGNGGIGNKGFLNGGFLNTGFAQLGLRNIGALNLATIPNTISVFNVPLAPNLTPPIPLGRRRRRRSTMQYPEGKFPWIDRQIEAGNTKSDKKK
ncbi:putative PPE family protein PPE13 [Orchesella cincta]|uniref:Putative PPE family protein PPE13 n=1 Tax=Orchesella cincta TaxID=48709 RepID=A0A1D2N1D9_ORCCI|nr:putative PPE family protein PPE13 [Orchesella cincta]